MINELRIQLARERARRSEIVGILDKRIKHLEKAINNLESYNGEADDVKSVLSEYKLERVVDTVENQAYKNK